MGVSADGILPMFADARNGEERIRLAIANPREVEYNCQYVWGGESLMELPCQGNTGWRDNSDGLVLGGLRFKQGYVFGLCVA